LPTYFVVKYLFLVEDLQSVYFQPIQIAGLQPKIGIQPIQNAGLQPKIGIKHQNKLAKPQYTSHKGFAYNPCLQILSV
jgi:hypothetical protein